MMKTRKCCRAKRIKRRYCYCQLPVQIGKITKYSKKKREKKLRKEKKKRKKTAHLKSSSNIW